MFFIKRDRIPKIDKFHGCVNPNDRDVQVVGDAINFCSIKSLQTIGRQFTGSTCLQLHPLLRELQQRSEPQHVLGLLLPQLTPVALWSYLP